MELNALQSVMLLKENTIHTPALHSQRKQVHCKETLAEQSVKIHLRQTSQTTGKDQQKENQRDGSISSRRTFLHIS